MNESSPGPIKAYPSAWPIAGASIFCSAAALFLFHLYSTLHWAVLARHYGDMSEDLRKALLEVLSGLEVYRVFALVALGCAIGSFQARPRWLSWIALPLALLAAATALVTQ